MGSGSCPIMGCHTGDFSVLTAGQCQRPYCVENAGSRPITAVKQRWAWRVLQWVTDGLDGPGSNPGGDVTGPRAPPASCTMGKMRLGRTADHSPPSSATVMEEQSYTSTYPLGHTGPVTGTLYFFTARQFINPLMPNDYSGRTAPLTSKRCILYI